MILFSNDKILHDVCFCYISLKHTEDKTDIMKNNELPKSWRSQVQNPMAAVFVGEGRTGHS